MSEVKTGQTVNVHYVGTLDDGTEFDSSRTRDQTLAFQVGSGQMISGFDLAVADMTVGETRTVTLAPGECYGEHRPDLVQTFAKSVFPEGFAFVVGATVQGQAPTGQPILAKIVSATDDEAVLDFNHPLAGQNLTFEIEVVSAE